MAISNLVVRSGIGSWTAIKYIITRGLDIGEEAAIWTPVPPTSTTWAAQSPTSSTWTPQTPDTQIWTEQ